MNACFRAIVRAAVCIGDDVVGIMHGYQGIYDEEFYATSDVEKQLKSSIGLGMRSVSGLSKRGGTVLHSSRCHRFTTPEGVQEAARLLHKHGFDALLPIGGNGTQGGALDLSKVWDGRIIGLPGTIDNDLLGTDVTIGFATAVNTAVEAVDKLRDTAGSHDMMFFVEVMGRHCGDIAIHTAIASGAELICVPEIPTDVNHLVRNLKRIKQLGKKSVIMIVAEGDDLGDAVEIQRKLKEAGNPFDSRVVVLGHTQRGGSPVPADRILASELGCFAVESLHKGETGKMAGMINGKPALTPLEDCISGHRHITPEYLYLLQIIAG